MKKVLSAVLVAVIAFSLCVCSQARLVGDVNGDAKVTSADALDVLKYSIGASNTINTEVADVNTDKSINSTDALIILQICVGSYKGELEVPDKLITSYKKDTVDPIIKSGKFTITTVVDDGETSTPVKIEFNGSDFAATMTVSGMEVRILLKNGKTYMVIPALNVYGEIDKSIEIGNYTTDDSQYYTQSTKVTINGKEYICENFAMPDKSQKNYYFLNGQLAMIENIEVDDTSKKQTITEFKSGINASSFNLTGIKVDLNSIMKK